MSKVYINQLSAVQYLIDRADLAGGRGTVEDGVYFSIAKAYQDVMDGHYDSAIARLRDTAVSIEYIESNVKENKKSWNTLRKDF